MLKLDGRIRIYRLDRKLYLHAGERVYSLEGCVNPERTAQYLEMLVTGADDDLGSRLPTREQDEWRRLIDHLRSYRLLQTSAGPASAGAAATDPTTGQTPAGERAPADAAPPHSPANTRVDGGSGGRARGLPAARREGVTLIGPLPDAVAAEVQRLLATLRIPVLGMLAREGISALQSSWPDATRTNPGGFATDDANPGARLHVVCKLHGMDERRLLDENRRWHAMRQPWLLIDGSIGDHLAVGPMFGVLDELPCFHCFTERRWHTGDPTVRHVLPTRSEAIRDAAPTPPPAWVAAWWAGVIAGEIERWWRGELPITLGRAVYFDTRRLEMWREEVLAWPECPVCHGSDRPASWTTSASTTA